MTVTSAYVLILMLFNANEANMGVINMYTFTGPNAMSDCVYNGMRISQKEEPKLAYATTIRAHCQRIDVTP